MMSNTIEKILLTLFLILGLNIFNITHAQSEMPLKEELKNERCPIKNDVSLRLDGTTRNGELIGFIDNNFVSWFVTMGNITDYYNGNFVNLTIKEINYHEYALNGWIGSYYVRWTSFGGYFNERVNCR